jgi:hypothetical protein
MDNPSEPRVSIVIARDFSPTPGFRYISDGPKSGEEFRQLLLEPHFRPNASYPLLVDFDGVVGFATSFLEEAFGGLARIVDKETCLRRLEFKSEEDPLLIDEVISYIEEA